MNLAIKSSSKKGNLTRDVLNIMQGMHTDFVSYVIIFFTFVSISKLFYKKIKR